MALAARTQRVIRIEDGLISPQHVSL